MISNKGDAGPSQGFVGKGKEYEAGSLLTSNNKVDKLGQGNFGRIQCCVHKELGKVAVKCRSFFGSSELLAKEIKDIKDRVGILSSFKHENLVQIYGFSHWDDNCFGIIMELCVFGNLLDLLLNKENETIDWKLRLRMFQELASALDYLHNHDPKKSYIHKDVKSENVLLTAKFSIKLADFGSMDMKIATGHSTSTNIISNNQHTQLYAAPEVLKHFRCGMNEFEFTSASDIYSFSMVGYEIVTLRQVYSNKDGRLPAPLDLILYRIVDLDSKPESIFGDVEQELNNPQDKEIFIFLRQIVEACWQKDPKDRPKTASLKEDLINFKQKIVDGSGDAALKMDEFAKKFDKSKSFELVRTIPLKSYFTSLGSVLFYKDTKSQSLSKNLSNDINKADLLPINSIVFSEGLPTYDMNHPERGCFVIFQQNYFDALSQRCDRDVDALNMQRAAEALGFEYVKIFKDSTRGELLRWLQMLGQACHKSYDSFACAILTDGVQFNEFRVRDGTVHLSECTQYFASDKCTSLSGKPKLFFISCPQGSSMLQAQTSEVTSEMENASISRLVKDLESAQTQRKTGHGSLQELYPDQSDFLIVYSSPPGYACFRNANRGSIFIDCLSECLIRDGKSMELMQIMTKVSRAMLDRKLNLAETKSIKQLPPYITSQLSGAVYFHQPTVKTCPSCSTQLVSNAHGDSVV